MAVRAVAHAAFKSPIAASASFSGFPRARLARARRGLGGALQPLEPLLQSRQALSELAQVNRAVARCRGSGRGPCLSCLRAAIASSEGGPDLGVGGGEQARQAAGQLAVRGQGRELRLPELEIAAGKSVEIGITHGATIAARTGFAALQNSHDMIISQSIKRQGVPCRSAT